MTKTTSPTLSGVAETLLLPLYIRALESQRPDALLKDDKAVALVKQMDYDSSWMTKMRVDEEDQVGACSAQPRVRPLRTGLSDPKP